MIVTTSKTIYNYQLQLQGIEYTLSLSTTEDKVTLHLVDQEGYNQFMNKLSMTDIKQLDIFCKSVNLDHFMKTFERIAKSCGIKLKQHDSDSTIILLTEIYDGYLISSNLELKRADSCFSDKMSKSKALEID
jgi:hypothetical protein